MNLISCNGCGVVLDKDKIRFPSIYDEALEVIAANSAWSQENEVFVAKVDCPVCGEEVTE